VKVKFSLVQCTCYKQSFRLWDDEQYMQQNLLQTREEASKR